jgi:Sugar phosphate isomerases/epimerases
MKKAINIWSFKGGTPVRECIKIAREAGFDGIELALAEDGEINLKTTENELDEIKKFAADEGIELPSVASGLYWSYSLTNPHKAIRDRAKSIVKKQLETAAVLGADTILVVPGAVGVDFIPDCKIVSYDKAYELSLEAMTELKDEAEKLKVSIGIENVWNKFLLSPLEMRSFIDSIGSSFVGAYLDVGNVIYTGYPEQWVRILGKRIKKLHFKDFRRSVGTLSGFVDLLAGDVDYPEVIKALGEIGYDGYVTAEMIPGYTHHSNQIVYNTSCSMDKILEK